METTTGPCDPRIERTRRLVLEATVALLADSGYGAVTIEAVAARSGVAKSTIYRHWPGRVELVRDAFLELKPPHAPPAEGDVREQVIAVLENFARAAAESQWSRCLPSLIDAAAHDPEARRLHSQISSEGRRSMVDLLAAGVANGDLPADLDPELMAEALAGPILLRILFSLPPLEPGQVRPLVDQLIPPLTAAATAARGAKLARR
jgi:TetR/AcrR family transcriptional regulator, regulator of autoinduction and epiphytic fitness